MRILVPAVKLGLGCGVIYLAADQGLFSDNQKESINVSKKISQSFPAIKPYTEKMSVIISKEEMIRNWNTGVKISFNALAALPMNSKIAFHKGMDYLKEEIKNQTKSTTKTS